VFPRVFLKLLFLSVFHSGKEIARLLARERYGQIGRAPERPQVFRTVATRAHKQGNGAGRDVNLSVIGLPCQHGKQVV